VSEKETTQKRRVGDGTPGPGRKKGVPNKTTTEFRETVRQLLENNAGNVERWLTMVAEGDGTDNPRCQPDPGKALDLLAKLAEYAAPKLARTEVVGDKEAPQHHVIKWQDD
jgi:hypothetical protein